MADEAPRPMAIDSDAPSAGEREEVLIARRNWGLTGQGQTVVIIDSGIAYDHPALGGGLGTGYRVVGGWDFAEGDANPYDDRPGGLHGTHVAGVVGGADPRYPGVAPGVDLVALRVFGDQGEGGFAEIESALQWVHAHRNEFVHPVTAVNISIGADWNASTIPAWSRIEDDLARLDQDGILIFASAGNDFGRHQTPGLSYPASSPHVIPAGSLAASGELSDFSQRDSRILAAPGEGILSTVPDYAFDFNGRADDFMALSGTSMAAPYLTGAAVLVGEAIELTRGHRATAAELEAVLRRTARSIEDPVTQQTYASLDLVAALRAVIPPDEPGSQNVPTRLAAVGGTLRGNGVMQTVNDLDHYRFLAARTETAHVGLNWTGEASESPRLILNGSALPLSADGGTVQLRAGESYDLVVAGRGGIGMYEIALDIASSSTNPPAAAIRSPYATSLGIAESHLQWTATEAGSFTVLADFDAPGLVTSFVVRNQRTGAEVARRTDPLRYEQVTLNSRVGETWDIVVHGRSTDADLRIVRGASTNSSADPFVILTTRLSVSPRDAQLAELVVGAFTAQVPAAVAENRCVANWHVEDWGVEARDTGATDRWMRELGEQDQSTTAGTLRSNIRRWPDATSCGDTWDAASPVSTAGISIVVDHDHAEAEFSGRLTLGAFASAQAWYLAPWVDCPA